MQGRAYGQGDHLVIEAMLLIEFVQPGYQVAARHRLQRPAGPR
jgi:hypothetical protein